MPVSLTLRAGTLYAFLLVLARVSGAVVFVPLPGFTAAAGPARAVFTLGFTLALFPLWPVIREASVGPATLAAWAAAESVVGIAIGVSVAIVLEAFLLAGQVLGLQAGYAYAQTIDPNTQADSGILLVFAQLIAGLCFFALGLDREILRLFARSLQKVPPGAYVFGPHTAEPMIRLASHLFSVGVRLALPVVALLVMVDVALALLGRLNSQLQLLSLAFPMKMLIALVVLSWIAVLFPRILRDFSALAFAAAQRMLGI
jgi:flagellar biosynthetic protein FliR